MPPWGRPPGGQGRKRRDWDRPADDVYRFQELDSDEDGRGLHGVPLDPSMQKGRQSFNPDELYFNDMDPRAWEQMLAERDGLAYGDAYEPSEDEEGYYEEGGGAIVHLAPLDQEEVLFQRVLDKIRRARGTGKPNVALSQEELEAYESRMLRKQQAPAPAARPPVKNKSSGATSSSASSSTRSKRGQAQQRSSIFSSPKPTKKPSGKKRASDAALPPPAQPPGFMIPGPNGQPMYAPITYNPRGSQSRSVRDTSSPSRSGSRSASISSRNGNHPSTPPREAPGAFPTDSPQRYRDTTPPLTKGRQSSYPPRQNSYPEEVDWGQPTRNQSSSSVHQLPVQPAPQLVPFPAQPYQHYSAEPYQYHMPQSAPSLPATVQRHSPPQSAPQYVQNRRISSGPPDGFVNIPRRLPVPGQRASMHSAPGMQSSYSDPSIGYKASGLRDELSDDDDDDGQHGVLVDVVQEAGSGPGYNVNVTKPIASGSENGTGTDNLTVKQLAQRYGGGGSGSGGGRRRGRRK